MRRPIVAVALAALILATVTVAGLGIAACGDSSGSATTQAAATGPAGGGQPPDMSAMFAQALDPLVEDGTITSDLETAVVTALTSSMASGGPGQGDQSQNGQMPSPGATPPNGQAPSAGATPPGGRQGAAPPGSAPDPGRMFSSVLDALVSDGTITSAQETAISEALSSAMLQGGSTATSSAPTS
jgi:hypothetical protein